MSPEPVPTAERPSTQASPPVAASGSAAASSTTATPNFTPAAWVPLVRVWSLARNTFTELVRSKVFYIVAVFGLIVLGASSFLTPLTFEQELKVLKDIALGSMGIFTTLLAIAATAMLIPNDVEDRTLYTILAKPVTRLEYLLGKLGGVFLLIGALTLLMALLASGVLGFRQWQMVQNIYQEYAGRDPEILQGQLRMVEQVLTPSFYLGIALIYLKGCVLATICLAVSTITTSTIFTILCSAAIYFIGHVQGTAREYWLARSGGEPTSVLHGWFLKLVALLFPDLQMFNLSDDITAGTALPLNVFAMTAGWGLFFILFYILVGYLIFSKKEL